MIERHPIIGTQERFWQHCTYLPDPTLEVLKISEKKLMIMDELKSELGHAHNQAAALKALKRSLTHWATLAKTKFGANLRKGTSIRQASSPYQHFVLFNKLA